MLNRQIKLNIPKWTLTKERPPNQNNNLDQYSWSESTHTQNIALWLNTSRKDFRNNINTQSRLTTIITHLGNTRVIPKTIQHRNLIAINKNVWIPLTMALIARLSLLLASFVDTLLLLMLLPPYEKLRALPSLVSKFTTMVTTIRIFLISLPYSLSFGSSIFVPHVLIIQKPPTPSHALYSNVALLSTWDP